MGIRGSHVRHIKGVTHSRGPTSTDLALHVRDQYVGNEVVAGGIRQDGIGIVCFPGLFRIGKVVVVDEPFGGYMRNVVELCHYRVEEFGTGESVLGLDLRGKVTEDDQGGLVFSDEDRADQKLVVGQPLRVTILSARRPIPYGLHGAHLGSAASNSRITKSVSSGR